MAERIFFRLQTRLSAKIYSDAQFIGKATIIDLSTTGIGLEAATTTELPAIFYVKFKLGGQPLDVRLEIKNKNVMARSQRVGALMLGLGEDEREEILDYILKNSDTSSALLVNASFFLSLDAVVKTFIGFLMLYYSQTDFGRAAGISCPASEYLVVAYLFFTLTAFFSVQKGDKKSFSLSLVCLVAAFLFLSSKVSRHLVSVMDGPLPVSIQLYFLLEAAVLIYAGYAAANGIFNLKKIFAVKDGLEKYILKNV